MIRGLPAFVLRPLAWCILLGLFFRAGVDVAVAAGYDSVTEFRPFRGVVRRDMAERAARVAAELEIFERVARTLAKEPDMHFVGGPEAPGFHKGGGARTLLYGAARMVVSTKLLAIGVDGFPPNLRAAVRLGPEQPEDLRAALHAALSRHDLLEFYAEIHERQIALLERYDALAEVLLPLNTRMEGGGESLHSLQSITNEMAALDIFIGLLPLYEEHWTTSQKARAELARAERLAPDNPLILTSLAELHLQMDRPSVALDYVSRALAKSPAYARAQDVRGAILLRQRLPALAVDSFSRAIRLAPRNTAYYVHRASAYLVQEEENGMCRDFQSACGLGDCEGLQWAMDVGKCAAAGQ